MVMAKERGYYVPDSLYNSWLKFSIEKSKDSSYNLNYKTYLLYILALGQEARYHLDISSKFLRLLS